MEKKEWCEPELIVLVRSNPEEMILAACKVYARPGPGGQNLRCNNYPPGLYCMDCSADVSS